MQSAVMPSDANQLSQDSPAAAFAFMDRFIEGQQGTM